MSTLSDSGHEHDHVHIGFGGAAVTFLILGAIEIVLGILISNPAVTNLGVHDLSDVIFPGVAILVGVVTIRLSRHWPTCQAETWAAFLIGLSNILVIGGLTILSVPSGINSDQLVLGLGSGGLSFAANFFWARQLDCQTDERRRAVSLHLRLDAYAAIAVAGGSGAAFLIDSIWPAMAAALYVLYLTIKHSGPELVRLSKGFHRQKNHLLPTKDHHHH